MSSETPYQYYDKKLGFKIKYLVSDPDRKHPDSLCLIKYMTLYKRMNSDKSCETKLGGRSCFGSDCLVLLSSLDRVTKDRITLKFGKPVEEIKKSWFAQNYMPDREAFDFFVKHTYGDDNKKLDLKYVETYTYNASVLNTVINCKTNRKEYIKARGATSIDIWDSLSKDVNAFREIEHDLPTTRDGLRRKVNQYINDSYSSLISNKFGMQNAARIKTEEQMALVDELIAKHNNLDNAQISKIYNQFAERLGWDMVTPPTVANRRTKTNLVTFAGRKGTDGLSNKMLMQNKRSKPTLPMLYATLDGWDAELLYQKTSIDKKGASTTTYHNRLTIVIVLDPFNKYPLGYAIGTHETPELIKQAMFNAIVHTKELFGDYYKPLQLQSDNYSKKTLTPLYEACCKHYTPARVKNAKAKVIEPYFGYINKNYCQMFDNWSGFGIASGSKNQPNSEMLNKIRHYFPDEAGCRAQLETIIATERANKRPEYYTKWQEVSSELRLPMPKENFLLTLGQSSGHTNKLTGEGIKIKIAGETVFYDTFDLNFRKLKHIDWSIKYNPTNLDEAMAVSPNGEYRFMLEQKYIQPMALAQRSDDDAVALQRIKDHNKQTTSYIIGERQKNHEKLLPLWDNPLLDDTLAKHLLVDSRGQHKDQRNKPRNVIQAAEKIQIKQEKAIQKQADRTWQDEQDDYINQKIDLSQYLKIQL